METITLFQAALLAGGFFFLGMAAGIALNTNILWNFIDKIGK